MKSPRAFEPDAFAYRVNYAAKSIMKNSHSRSADACFEMGDGCAVVVAIVRRAKKNPKLYAAIASQWSGVFPAAWLAIAEKYAAIPTRGLADLSRDLRAA